VFYRGREAESWTLGIAPIFCSEKGSKMTEHRNGNASEVARLRQQIAEEIESLEGSFHAFAVGTARHDFIRMRMDSIGDRQDKLASYVGEDNAEHMVCELYMNIVKHDG
jgi:hypothetical protein